MIFTNFESWTVVFFFLVVFSGWESSEEFFVPIIIYLIRLAIGSLCNRVFYSDVWRKASSKFTDEKSVVVSAVWLRLHEQGYNSPNVADEESLERYISNLLFCLYLSEKVGEASHVLTLTPVF